MAPLSFRRACWLLFLAVVLTVQVADGAPSEAIVTSLPGFAGSFASEHYSGYVTVDEATGRSLFYYFVTSEGDPTSDPVVLWLNGGPGCSSFDGFVYEHGPFLFHPAKEAGALPTLTRNHYTWAKNASVLYLDSPAGVGFSYSNDTNDYNTGDLKTAQDTHAFLLKWFTIYSEFQSNPFFVSGESWAGVYVPTLVREIVAGIQEGVTPAINLKGYLVGNGVTDDEADGNAYVPFAYGMGLISSDLYLETVKACNGSFWLTTSDECNDKLDKIFDITAGLNVYDILEPCFHPPSQKGSANSQLPPSFATLGQTERPYPIRKRMIGRAWPLGLGLKDGPVPSWATLSEGSAVMVPCVDTSVAVAWLNDAGVRSAIHARPESGTWQLCASLNYVHDTGSMIPIHRNLTEAGYRALIYSGDHDFCVPYTGSEAWTSSMGYKTTDDWRPWYLNDQVAGFTRSFEHGLTFATVKGAGHTVPEYKPREALALFQRFLRSEKL